MFPELPRVPALTEAESRVIDAYISVLKRLGETNPAQTAGTYTALRAAQALVSEARELRDALSLMFERHEKEIHVRTMAKTLECLEGHRLLHRIALAAEDKPDDPSP